MQVCDKTTVHVTMTKDTKAMIDVMAEEDAPAGQRADRSRLLGLLVKREWERRGKGDIVPEHTGKRHARGRKR